MNYLLPLKHWDRGFESHSSHGCLFVFVLSCVQVAALRRAEPPSMESYRLCKKIRKLEKWPRSIKGLYRVSQDLCDKL
jgi:hypothetical protein